ncbi:MAG: PhoH family protein [Planctomycetaceae bacterium]|jgi:phosphate starvation-inducible PhoH-like protein|nr:PhoH family protein [Planctomycetaceae bacterium]
MYETTVSIIDSKLLFRVFGASDENLRLIRKLLGVQVTLDEGKIIIRGNQDAIQHGATILEHLQKNALHNKNITLEDIERAIAEVKQDKKITNTKPIEVFGSKQIRPKTVGQASYVEELRRREIVFCVGPAGTGKTYLAVAKSVEALKNDLVKKIVLVRPAVEAGENLGFLPGDLQAKINPYLRPLFDALADMLERDLLKRYMEEDRIEVIPLAYMRGRTINNASIILDEAQNTTVAQMKMFLTRMGDSSTIVVCGDTTQIDLPQNKKSGLIDALHRLKHINEIAIVKLNKSDIVRHRLVQKIVNAYDNGERG